MKNPFRSTRSAAQEHSYMSSAIPVAADFTAPQFLAFCLALDHPLFFRRKLWEWAFIEHAFRSRGYLEAGKRGLCFGVGAEALPALFAANGCTIVATDGPQDVVVPDWRVTGQYSENRDVLFRPTLIEKDAFESRVYFEFCDMNAIGNHLRDFDFCWSSCCLEHLGSLEAGADFIFSSVGTLRPGGLAVHTTELNLSSNEETIEHGPTVIYRRRDIADIKDRARKLGHIVHDFPIREGATAIDTFVDIPPYRHDPHLRLRLGSYVSTSVAIVIEAAR